MLLEYIYTGPQKKNLDSYSSGNVGHKSTVTIGVNTTIISDYPFPPDESEAKGINHNPFGYLIYAIEAITHFLICCNVW